MFQASGNTNNNTMAMPSASPLPPNPGDPQPILSPSPLRYLTRRFRAFASRALQEAVKFPEDPPPVGWSPGDPLHSFYEARLYKFRDLFRDRLERQGNMMPTQEPRAFRSEWLAHSRSVMANIRAEWEKHPLGSTDGWKSSANTPNRYAAVSALRYVTESPNKPPPEWWEMSMREGTGRVEDLHVYYQIMLARFEAHMERVLVEHGARLGMSREEMCQATAEYMVLVIRMNRETWKEMSA